MISKDQQLNFGIVENNGKHELVALTRRPADGFFGRFEPYKGTMLEAIVELAKSDNIHNVDMEDQSSEISTVWQLLQNPLNTSVSKEQFLEYVLGQEKDGTPRICTLGEQTTAKMLELAEDKKIKIDFCARTPSGETLFTRWASRKFGHKIVKTLLRLDPSIIHQVRTVTRSPYAKAILQKQIPTAKDLLEAMTAQGISLNQEETWLKRAQENNTSFSEQEYKSLSSELQEKIFFTANTYGCFELVAKLQPWRSKEKPLFLNGKHVFSGNMDIKTVKERMESYLKELRKNKLLLTKKEFEGKADDFISKGNQLGRIAGRDFVEKIAQENGLTRIKAPKKIIVINEGVTSLTFYLSPDLEMTPKEGIEVYAQKINRIQRNLTLEEGIQMMIALEKTGFNDFAGDNFFLAEDGIYFIDTEFTNFSPETPNFSAMESIQKLLNPKDVTAFSEAFQKRKDAFEADKAARDKKQKDIDSYFSAPYKNLAKGFYYAKIFTFPVDQLK
jgi:hypothetical protein